MKTIQRIGCIGLVAALAACNNTPANGTATGGTNGGGTGGTSGGTGGCGLPANCTDAGLFTVCTVDGRDAGLGEALAMAVGPDDRIGLAYFFPLGTETFGQPDLAVTYAEFKGGNISVAPSQITTVQVNDGVTVAFNPTDGEPSVGYVGGTLYFYDGGLPDGGAYCGSTTWLEHSATIARMLPGGTWEQDICMTDSTEDGNFHWPTSDPSAYQLINFPAMGGVVGMWPALLYDGGTAFMAYRDVHTGQFPIQDWGASDIKMCAGTAPMNWQWTCPMTVQACNDHKQDGFGVHTQMVFGANGALAIASANDTTDQGGVVTGGVDGLEFVLQKPGQPLGSDWNYPIQPFNPNASPGLCPPGSPTEGCEIGDSESGPGLVFDPSFGYGVVAVDVSLPSPVLMFVSSMDGLSWGQVEVIAGAGSEGYYPSSPSTHRAAIHTSPTSSAVRQRHASHPARATVRSPWGRGSRSRCGTLRAGAPRR